MIVPTRGPEPFFFPGLGSRPPKTMSCSSHATADDDERASGASGARAHSRLRTSNVCVDASTVLLELSTPPKTTICPHARPAAW